MSSRDIQAVVVRRGSSDARVVTVRVQREHDEDVPRLKDYMERDFPVYRMRLNVHATSKKYRDGQVQHDPGTDVWEIEVYHSMPLRQDCDRYVIFFTSVGQAVDGEQQSDSEAVSPNCDIAVFRQSLNRSATQFTSIKQREDRFGLHGVFQ